MIKLAVLSILLCAFAATTSAADGPERLTLNIEPQPVRAALKELSGQTGVQVLLRVDNIAVDGMLAPKVSGELTVREALERLLEKTGLKYEFVNEKTVRIVPAASMEGAWDSSSPGAQSANPDRKGGRDSQNMLDGSDAAIPEVLVTGSRMLNTDIKRTRDDAQPYVVFDHDTLARSGAGNVGDFLKDRLPMNSVSMQNSQSGNGFGGSTSQINLRGLGPGQTLVLIDGRRVSGSSTTGNSLGQADLNGIPLAAVERIEVLPTTASGIYGGAATGGVVNVILRRDYSGAELNATYDSDFDATAPMYRLDTALGFNLFGDRTRLLLFGSHARSEPLLAHERKFLEDGRGRIAANNPGFFNQAVLPPLGSRPNLLSANGSPLFGAGTPNFTSVPAGYASGAGIAPLRSNAGAYNLELADSADVPGGALTSLLYGSTVNSGSATVTHEFGDHIRAFIDLGAANNAARGAIARASNTFTLPISAPTNPFGQAVFVTVPLSQITGTLISDHRTRRATGGVTAGLGRTWRVQADYTWSASSHYNSAPGTLSAAAQTAINAGALNILVDPATAPIDVSSYLNPPLVRGPFKTVLRDASVRLAGAVGALPAGPVSLSSLAEHRRESVEDGFQITSPTTTVYFPQRKQSVRSVYLEANFPVVSGGMTVAGVHALDLQVAGRWEEYSINSASNLVVNPTPASSITRNTSTLTSTNPTVAVRYEIVPGIAVRGSFGTGFLPPGLDQTIPSPPTASRTVRDPRRGGATTVIPAGLAAFGGNPDLAPEESESFSAGLVFSPAWAAGARVSLDFTRIEKTDEIRELSSQQIVDNEQILSGRVTRGAVPGGDPFGVGPIVAVDSTLINLATSRIEAFDLGFDYALETASAGTWALSAAATRQTHYETRLLPASPVVENVGVTSGFPLKLRGNAQLTWSLDRWAVSWAVRYFDSYRVADPATISGMATIFSQGSLEVPSQSYHDLFLEYRFPADAIHADLLSGLELRLGVRNVFDTAPPFDVTNGGFYYSFYGDPRLASYFVSLRKAL